MSTDLKQWLWRLDKIGREWETLRLASSIHVAFSLGINKGFSSDVDLIGTFPFGRALAGHGYATPMYEDPETSALWFAPGGGQGYALCWDWEEGLSSHDHMPSEFFAKYEDSPFGYPTLCWYTWYYLPSRKSDWGRLRIKADDECNRVYFAAEDLAKPEGGAEVVKALHRFYHLEAIILEACALAPLSVVGRMGNLTDLGSWPTVLLHLAVRRYHPLILVEYTADIPKSGTGRSRTKRGKWADVFDRVILLSPDLWTATAYAFEAFRIVATAAQPTDEQASRAEPQAAKAGNQKQKGKRKAKRGAKPSRDAKHDKQVYEARKNRKLSYPDLAREFYGDETKTKEVAKAIDSHRHRLKRMGK